LIADADGYAPSATWTGGRSRETVDLFLSPAARVGGRVIERRTRRPVAGAEVLVRSDLVMGLATTVREAKTDGEGRFEVRDLDPGSYDLLARHGADVGRLPGKLVVTGPGAWADATVEIDRGAVVTGTVRAAGGAPVRGARVVLTASPLDRQPLAQTVTTASGTFALEGVLPGRARVVAEAPGLTAADAEALVLAGQSPEPVRLTLPAEAVVRAQVVSPEGAAVAGAAVTLTPVETGVLPERPVGAWSARTGADGMVVFDRLPAGTLALAAEHAEGRASLSPLSLHEGEHRGTTLTLQRGAAVSGVVRWEDGALAAGVTVVALGQPAALAMGKTAADGSYSLGPLPAGAVKLFASRKEGPAALFSEGIMAERLAAPGSFAWLRLGGNEGRRGVDLTLARGGLKIQGLVRTSDGTPLAAARVVAEDQHLGTGGIILRILTGGRALGPMAAPSGQSDADGRFSIDDLAAGKYRLRASFPGQPDLDLGGVSAGSGGVVLTFAPGATVAGRVVRADGSPVTDCDLVVRPAGEQPGPAMVAHLLGASGKVVVHDPAGAFRVPGLGAGRYELRATDAAGEAGKLAVTVAKGAAQDGLRVVVGPGVVVVGRVVDDAHLQPLAGATATVLTDTGMRSQLTDSSGQFRLDGLMPGEPLQVVIQRAGHVAQAREVAPSDAVTRDLGTVELVPRLDEGP
jgi:hypothetical protein